MTATTINPSELILAELKALKVQMDAEKAERATADATRKAEIDQKLAAIEARQNELKVFSEQAAALSLPGVTAGKKGEKGKFSFGRMAKLLCGVAKISDPEYGYEKDVNETMTKRLESMPAEFKTALNAATDAAGAFLIPTELQAEIIPELEAMSIAAALGVQQIGGLVGNVNWVREEGAFVASYIDTEVEEAINETTTTFSSIEGRPHVLGAFVPLTWSMINQPAVAIEQWVRGRIAKKIALRRDRSVFRGIGGTSEPLGLLGLTGAAAVPIITWPTAGVPTAAQWGGGATPAQEISPSLRKMMEKVATNNAFEGATKLGWATTPRFAFGISEVKDKDLNLVFIREALAAGAANSGVLNSLLGYQLRMSTQLTETATTDEHLIFGDWATVLDLMWGMLAFASSTETETNFRKLRTTIRAVMAHDVIVTQPKAFSAAGKSSTDAGVDTTNALT